MKLKFLPLFLFLCFASVWCFAQSEVSKFILSGQGNANLLASAYFDPLAKSISSNLGSGWISGRKSLETGHFELLMVGNATFIPHKVKNFNLYNIGLNAGVHIEQGYTHITPTALGDDAPGIPLIVTTPIPNTDRETSLAYFNTPNGLGIPLVPLPAAQFNAGLIRHTKLALRLLPNINFRSDGTHYETYLWGVGLIHQISGWMKETQKLPFDITVAMGYSRQKAKGYTKRIASWGQRNTVRSQQQKDPDHYSNQHIAVDARVYLVELLLSKEVASFTFSTGLQYSIGKTYIDTPGIYPQVDIRASNQEPYYEFFFNDVNNPIGIEIPYHPFSLNLGMDYRIKALTLGVSGNFAYYKILSASLGFTF